MQFQNNSDIGSEMLRPDDAYLSMATYIRDYFIRAGNDLITLIGDTDILDDGRPLDDAAWEDWIGSVGAVKSDKNVRAASWAGELVDRGRAGGGSISSWEAFLAMTEFIWRHAKLVGDDLHSLMVYIGRGPEGNPDSEAAWLEWLNCVEYVKSGGKLRVEDEFNYTIRADPGDEASGLDNSPR